MKTPLIFALLVTLFSLVCAVHDSLNFVLPPGKRECYFEEFDAKAPSRTIESFIQSVGNVDVLLTIHGPLSLEEIRSSTFENPIVKEKIDSYKESESDSLTFVTEFKPQDAGVFAICLDNRNSRFLQKIVQLDVQVPMANTPVVLKMKSSKGAAEGVESESEELLKAQESISRIRAGLLKIQQQQLRDRHRLSLHSETNKSSHSYVMQGLVAQTFLFILASLFQLLFVRRWFAGRASGLSTVGGKQRV